MRESYDYVFKVTAVDSMGGNITDRCNGPDELSEVIKECNDKGWKIWDIDVIVK